MITTPLDRAATKADTLSRAHKVLNPRSKSIKSLLDSQLPAAWLNYAHGVYNGSAKVHGKTTFAKAIAIAEKHRKSGTAVQVKKVTTYLAKHVNS
ncbi:MAG: hypothetical protein HOV86_00740 [Thermoactinospora sp.]|nr:hypothetical protein [Thermoactinospora sp.]